MAKCKDCGTTVNVLEVNTTNLMSHQRTKHPKVYEVARQKTDEKKSIRKQTSQATTKPQITLPGMAARKAKLDSNSTLHK